MPTIKGTEIKKGKVISCVRNQASDWLSPNGMLYAFDVEMDNGDRGTYKAKNADNPKFVIGQEATYNIDTVTKKDGSGDIVGYNIRNVSEFKSNSGGGGYKPKSIEEQKSIILQVLLSELYDSSVRHVENYNSKLMNSIIQDTFNFVTNKVFSVDEKERASMSIEYCSAIKIAFKALSRDILTNTVEITSELINEKIEKTFNFITHNRFKK
jgi:hypothetical protein